MNELDVDDVSFDHFRENNEWEECFNVVEKWDQEQLLIANSIAVDEESPKREYLEVLHRCFGHKSFRPMQWKIINSIINDKRDNCAIMATGYGKSLCFQYPSVYIGGVTIVVSPLISLMEDQVLSLTMSNINACLLGTAQNNKKQVVTEIFEGKYSLVYVTPEFCCCEYGHDLLQRMSQSLAIVLLAIDEAHCVSSWGHDFRYDYRHLGKIRSVLPNVPILAVTATATPKVRHDIVSCLKLKNPQILCSGFDRPNLRFDVYLKGASVFSDLRKAMTDKSKNWGFPGSTIIYCITRKQTEEVTDILQKKGIQCLAYHAGLTLKQRKDAHELFVKDKIKVIVATIAFGMGIDKPDVRNVIHYGASKDIESYYQEVGRAGRDGQPSICVTFYKNADFVMHETIRDLSKNSHQNRARQDAMQKIMKQYLESRECRRQFILNHFQGSCSENKPKPNCCDNCSRKLSQTVSDSSKYEGLNEHGLYDFTKDATVFLNAVEAMRGRFGMGMYILFLRGSKSAKLFEQYRAHLLHGSGKYQSEDWWKCLGWLLEREDYLKKSTTGRGGGNKAFTSNTFSVSAKGQLFLEETKKSSFKTKLLLTPTPEMFRMLQRKDQPAVSEEQLFTTKATQSTSVKRSSKPSLRLLKVSSESECKTKVKTISDNLNDSGEVDIEKEERMKVYRLLMNKRADLASVVDCMPYMVASNEALMKMSSLKPLTIKELRDCQLDGFTEAKINRFGEEFVKTIRDVCHLDPVVIDNNIKKNIQDILAEHPLPGASIGATAEASYSMYKSGLTVQEIAEKRGVMSAAALSHLIDAIKVGYPIRMIDLNVTDEILDTIVHAIRNPPINSDMSKLKPIKEACPPEITFDAIKVVIAFLQVREHLAKLNVEYVDFETSIEIPVMIQLPQVSQSTSNSRMETEITNKPINNQINKSSMNAKKKTRCDVESKFDDSLVFTYNSTQPNKRIKRCESSSDDLNFLDSPPRTSTEKLKSQKENDLIIPNSHLQENSDTLRNELFNNLDLEATFMQDDFFDNLELENVEKDIRQAKVNISSTGNETQEEELIVDNNSSKCEMQTKFKKFQFKSKVPLSVEQSSKELRSRLSSHNST